MENNLHYTGCTISTFHCKCFEKLTIAEKILLDKNSVKIKYKKHEIICKQGSYVSYLMYMETGLAKVFIDNNLNSLVLKVIPPGNLLGLTAVSDGIYTYPYSAMAYVESEVRQIDINVFRQFLKQNTEFAKEIIDILSSNSIQIYGRFFCLTHKQTYGKLADTLLCLSDRVFKNELFELPLSRKELAELSGMGSETVIRLIKKFIEDGLIKLNGKKIHILDRERLKRISETG